MKPPRIASSLRAAGCLAAWCVVAIALPAPGQDARTTGNTNTLHRLVIRPNPTADWGGVVENVQRVLQSAANELWRYFPDRELAPILVEPNGGPVVLFDRGPKGEYQVRLNTGKRFWAQHAYQFAHEFCHILCNYGRRSHPNKWFEESVCEMASLFALRRMALTWERQPPYPNWKTYARSLASYAADRIRDARLPKGQTLADWYREQADRLAANPVLRKENTIVAAALLPLFEAHPEHWESVAYLNVAEPHPGQSLAEFLMGWHVSVPEKHRAFVAEIAAKFAVQFAGR